MVGRWQNKSASQHTKRAAECQQNVELNASGSSCSKQNAMYMAVRGCYSNTYVRCAATTTSRHVHHVFFAQRQRREPATSPRAQGKSRTTKRCRAPRTTVLPCLFTRLSSNQRHVKMPLLESGCSERRSYGTVGANYAHSAQRVHAAAWRTGISARFPFMPPRSGLLSA